MTKNPSRFSTLVEAITNDIKTRNYLYNGIYPDNMIEIGADKAVGVGQLTRNVELIVCTMIQSLSFDKQVFIWSECFATRSEKDWLLNELSNRITDEELAKPIKASGISSQNGQKKKITCPV